MAQMQGLLPGEASPVSDSGDLAARAKAHGTLGFAMSVALVVGNMVGAGVFLLPANLAPLGWNSVYAWLITIGGSLCIAIGLARLARAMAGGCAAFTYADAAFGPAIGFVIAWSYWISVWVSVATLAVAAVSNLSILFPDLASVHGLPAIAALVPIWALTLINCLGVRRAGGFQLATMLLKLVPLVGAIAVGGWLLLTGNVVAASYPTQPVSAAGISTAAALTLFALLGFESALVAGERVEDAQRTVPRATLFGTAITGLIYLLACSAIGLFLPAGEVAHSNSPFALFFATLVSPALGALVALFAIIAALGSLNGNVLLQGELLLTLARRGMVPAWFAQQNRHSTPQRVHIFSSLLASLIVLANYTRGLADLFTFMVLVTTSVSILFYIAGSLACLKLARAGKIAVSPGIQAIAAIGFVYSVWAFYGAGLEAGVWSLAMTAAGIPIYVVMTRQARSRSAH